MDVDFEQAKLITVYKRRNQKARHVDYESISDRNVRKLRRIGELN